MRTPAALLAALCLAAGAHAAPAPLPKPGKDDAKNIQGSWWVVRMNANGEEERGEFLSGYKVEVTAGTWAPPGGAAGPPRSPTPSTPSPSPRASA